MYVQLSDGVTTENDGRPQLNRTLILVIVARGENNAQHLATVLQFFFHSSRDTFYFIFFFVSLKHAVETLHLRRSQISHHPCAVLGAKK